MVSKNKIIYFLLSIVIFITNVNSQEILRDEKFNVSFLEQQVLVSQNEKDFQNPPLNEIVSFHDDNFVELDVASEQEILDTMRKAFLNLPPIEMEKIGIDFKEPILDDGSDRSKQMKSAWIERQADIKLAMASIVKPAEHMSELAATIKNISSSVNQITEALIELESNVLGIIIFIIFISYILIIYLF
jgi:hypothetical protein